MNVLNTALQQTQTTTRETILSLPHQLKAQLPLSTKLAQQIADQRQTIQNILEGKDHRLMIVTGPCSIHDPISALEYAQKLQQLQSQVSDQIFLVMRTYIEKPRTTIGWKGFLYDPNLDNSSNMQLGLEKSRELYLQIIEMGLPIAAEILSPMATAYFDDLLAWGAIGARTSESQIHREISSHMPYSIGFKNGTDGSIQIALDAIQSASHSHQFMGMSQSGLPCIVQSQGNRAAHLILRGANSGPNYQLAEIEKIKAKSKAELPALVIDCSHGNSHKNPLVQTEVLRTIVAERVHSNVRGVMLESHLVDGQQKISCDMTYGQSVTDG
ncbi:MAG: 3-deoxy-7-phosphoheptulonate synthase, partial [Acinetobacter bohemicus]